MDYFVKSVLVIISSALIFIAAQAYQINESLKKIPTVGEYRAASAITDLAAKKEAFEAIQDRVPLTWSDGGSVSVSNFPGSMRVSGAVDVTGSSVEVHGAVRTY